MGAFGQNRNFRAVVVDAGNRGFDLYFPFVASKGLWFMACAQLAFFSWLVLAWHWQRYRPNSKSGGGRRIRLFGGFVFVGNFGRGFFREFLVHL